MRQPVSLAASRAFWPSRPIASESMRSGTVTEAMRFGSSMSTPTTCAGLRALATNVGGVLGPRDDVDLLAAQLRDDRLDASASLADRGSDRVEALLAARDRDLAAAARLAGDRLDLDRAPGDLRHLELEQAAQEVLVRAADVDERPARRAADLEDVGLHVLADAVMLGRRLVGRAHDGLGLAEVEDDPRRLHAADRAGDHLALAMRELVEERLPLRLAQALADDLARDLGADAAEMGRLELLVLEEVTETGLGVVRLGLVEVPLGRGVLHLGDDRAGAEDAHLAGVDIESHEDVLVPGRDAAIRRLDRVLDGPHELLPGDALLGVQLEERADELSTHPGASFPVPSRSRRSQENVGVTHVVRRP